MAPPLKIGLNVAFLKPEAMPAITRAAEAAGYESVWFGEHVALPKRDDWWLGYPGNPPTEGDMTFRPENLWLDPLIMFAHLAGTTSRIRFGVGIYMPSDPVWTSFFCGTPYFKGTIRYLEASNRQVGREPYFTGLSDVERYSRIKL